MPLFYIAIRYAAHFPFTLLNHPWIARIGVYSYAMYLIHYIVINVVEKNASWLARAKPLLVLVTFVIANAQRGNFGRLRGWLFPPFVQKKLR
jgi:peptidoglycan/LPS O-acetylase OafA/YrhL